MARTQRPRPCAAGTAKQGGERRTRRLLLLLLRLPLQVLALQHSTLRAGRHHVPGPPHRLLLQQQRHRLQRRLESARVRTGQRPPQPPPIQQLILTCLQVREDRYRGSVQRSKQGRRGRLRATTCCATGSARPLLPSWA